MIRRAGPEDLAAVVDLIQRFHATSWWPAETFDRETVEAFVSHMLSSDDSAVFLSEAGGIGLRIGGAVFNAKLRIAYEVFFWAPDGRGDALSRAAKAWADEHANFDIANSHRADPRAEHFYRRKGFVPLEASYVRAC